MSTLTKREQIAAMAMQGLLSNPNYASDACVSAAELADALLAELAKSAPASEPAPEPARTPGPNDVPGCEFVRRPGDDESSYIHPAGDTGERRCDCQCKSFLVGDTWHWHSHGICHNPTRCHGAEGGK